MLSKEDIFNLSLGALLLERRIVNAENDDSKEARILRTHWRPAFSSTLADLDLDATSSKVVLEKIADDPLPYWKYAYKYPSDCAFFRRIRTCVRMDNRYTHIDKEVSMLGNVKAIFTNQEQAIGEYISTGIQITSLSVPAAMAVAYRLALLSAPLITGKGASDLRKELRDAFTLMKADAEEQDQRENFVFEHPVETSEFVAERMS